MLVREIMREDFMRFNANDSLQHILFEFADKKISSAPVFEEDELLGVVSVKSIAAKFSQREFSSLWKKEKESPLDRMRKMTAAKLAVKPRARLKADDRLSDVLDAISGNEACIPVLESGKVVGMVRAEEVLSFLLTVLAKGEYGEIEAPAGKNASGAKEEIVGTTIDSVLAIVRRERMITAKNVAEELGISTKSVERLGETLSNHHIIAMDYTFLSGAILRLVDDGKR